jgi:DNA-binding protein H-NS
MSSIYEKIDNRIETFLNTLKRFPLASFSAFLFTIIMLILMDYHNHDNPNAIIASKVAFVATLGILLFPALQLLGRSVVLPLLGLVLLGVYYYFLPHNLDNMGFDIGIRHTLLLLALFFMLFWSPFLFKRSNNDTFWQYAQAIIFGLITAIFFALVVYAGLAAALFAIEKLFGIDIRNVRYGQLALLVFGIFGINFFLSQIPKYPLFMEVRPYSKIKRIFSKNILAPIAIVFFLILFAYTAKILISMSYPSGVLSWIIVAFSFVAIVSFLFLTPYLKKSSLPQRLIWLAIFLQTIMLGFALWMRVQEYGITYNRYLLALFGLWLLLMSLYFMLFGKAQQKWLFFFASLFILFSQFGPYSAKNVTKKSQTARLIQLIETAKKSPKNLDFKQQYEISNTIAYINEHYGMNAFEPIIPDILYKYKEIKAKQRLAQKKKLAMPQPYVYDFPSFATTELGFEFVNRWDWIDFKRNHGKKRRESHHFYSGNPQKPIDIQGYNYLINYHCRHSIYINPDFLKPTDNNDSNRSDINLTITMKENQFQVQHDHNTTLFDLSNYTKKLLEKETNRHEHNFPLPIYESTEDNVSIKVIFQRLTLSYDGNITDLSSQVLLKF